MYLNCVHCGEGLRKSIYADGGETKSCPSCSRRVGEHVYYELEDFGITNMWPTPTNPTGSQSYCAHCRATYRKGDVRKAPAQKQLKLYGLDRGTRCREIGKRASACQMPLFLEPQAPGKNS